MKKDKQKITYGLTILALIMIGIILFFGLRPKAWPVANDVQWLATEHSLRFHGFGSAYVDDVHSFTNQQDSAEFTLQTCIAVESLGKQGFRPILEMHSGDDRQQLSIWHWGASIIAMNGDDYDCAKKWPRISTKDVLVPGVATFITITSSPLGTRLFINGIVVKETKNWQLTLPDTIQKRRLILGNSVYGKHGWNGEMYGLALYAKALSPAKVKLQYDTWVQQKSFSPDLTEDLQLLFTFSGYDGSLIADQSGRGQSLLLPSWPIQLKKTFLSMPWHNFNPNRSFWVDAILNLLGFIPLGAVLYCWLYQSDSWSGRYGGIVVVLFCFGLSLSMEIVQGWLPYRISSLQDLGLNTLGAWLGVLLISMVLRFSRGKSPVVQ